MLVPPGFATVTPYMFADDAERLVAFASCLVIQSPHALMPDAMRCWRDASSSLPHAARAGALGVPR